MSSNNNLEDFQTDITIELRAYDGSTAIIDRTKGFSFTSTYNGSASWSATVPGEFDFSALKWLRAEVRIYFKDTFIFRGVTISPSGGGKSGEWTLTGEGVARQLKDQGPDEPLVIVNERTSTVLSDYISDETPFVSAVTERSTITVDRDKEVLTANGTSEWQEIIPEPNATDPYHVSFGGLELLQANFVMSGHQPDESGDGMTRIDSDEYAEGRAMRFDSEADYAEYEFSPAYNIPRPTIRIRSTGQSGPDLRVLLNGEEIDGLRRTHPIRWSHGMITFDETGNARDLDPSETHTVRIESADGPTDTTNGYVDIDLVSVYDHRFEYWENPLWPNDIDANGHLPGPYLYPDQYEIESETIDVDHNIASASLETDWTAGDVGMNQAIGISNDGGDNWAWRENSATLQTDFIEELGYPDRRIYGMGLKVAFRLGARGNRSDGTPGRGHQSLRPREVHGFVTTNDTSIIRDLTLDEDHLSNLQTICDETSFNFTCPHEETRREIVAFQYGEIARDADWNTRDWDRSIDPGDYFNRAVIRGAYKDEDNPDAGRYRAIEEAEDEIDTVGLVEHRPPADPELTSRDMCVQKAREDLDEGLGSPDIKGSVEIDPIMLTPGYAYQVPEFDDEYHTLEQIQFSIGVGEYDMSLDFEGLGSGIMGTIVGNRSDTNRLYRSV